MPQQIPKELQDLGGQGLPDDLASLGGELVHNPNEPIPDYGPELPNNQQGYWEDKGIAGKVWHPNQKVGERKDSSIFSMPFEGLYNKISNFAGKNLPPSLQWWGGALGSLAAYPLEIAKDALASPETPALGLGGIGARALRANLPNRLEQIGKQVVEPLSEVPTTAEEMVPKTPITKGQINPRSGKIPEPILDLRKQIINKAANTEIVPPEVIQAAKATGNGQKFLEVLNTAKEIKSAFDLPPLFRQGAGLLYRKESWQSVPTALKAMFNEKFFQQTKKEIADRLVVNPWMKKAGLSITDPEGPLAGREESFISNLGEKIPFLGRGIRASNRGYNTMLNVMRVSTAENMAKDLANMGRNLNTNPELAKEVAGFINNATGRGSLNLGKVLSGGYIEPTQIGNMEKIAAELNAGIFSPRLKSAQLTVLNPLYYAKADPFVRKEALKSLLGRIGLGTTMLGLVKAAGGKVNVTEPTNADFMKGVIGNTRLDPWAGEQQLAVLAARMAPNVGPFGKFTSSTSDNVQNYGAGYKPIDRLDIAGRFAKNTEAPVAALVHHLLTQKGSDNKPIMLSKEIKDLVGPMYASDIVELMNDNPDIRQMLMGVPAAMGQGLQTYSK